MKSEKERMRIDGNMKCNRVDGANLMRMNKTTTQRIFNACCKPHQHLNLCERKKYSSFFAGCSRCRKRAYAFPLSLYHSCDFVCMLVNRGAISLCLIIFFIWRLEPWRKCFCGNSKRWDNSKLCVAMSARVWEWCARGGSVHAQYNKNNQKICATNVYLAHPNAMCVISYST